MALASVGYADVLSIYEVQSTTTNGDTSYYAAGGATSGIHTVYGGIVTYMRSGYRDRVYLQDPAHPTWGAICVKDAHHELLSQLQVGDLATFSNIYVEDDVDTTGNTFLQFDRENAPDVSFTVESQGNPVPEPTVVPARDVRADPVDHATTEPYESMIVTLQDIEIGDLGLGRKSDNYELKQWSDDHWEIAWGTDYLNVDAEGDYHPWIQTGAVFESVTGIVEQNTKDGWDYYQVLTRSSDDLVPEPGTLALLAVGLTLVGRRR
jgi:hypothetical protein